MTNTTKQALREWTIERLQNERTRIQGKRDEFNTLAMTHEDARWHVRDCDDILQAIDNEMARRLQFADDAAYAVAHETNGEPQAIFFAWAAAMGYDTNDFDSYAGAAKLYAEQYDAAQYDAEQAA